MVLRSTVAPGTTEFVAGYLEKHRGFTVGEDVFVAHVPERIAADRFLDEIGTLPCIVGGIGEASGERAAELFAPLGAPIVQTTPVQAELAKIWTNILRYATFALPNLLMMDCERYDANVFEVIDLINRDYPRGGIALPGLTAGTCLRKDFAFSEEKSNAPGMLLAVSRVHESVPLFLVDGVKRRLGGGLRERKVAVLGLAFKADTDDERDSLSHKLIRLLERELADVAVHDPVVATPTLGLRGGDRRRRRGRRRHQPQRVLAPGGAAGDRRARRAPTAWSSTPGTRSARARSSPTCQRSRRAAGMSRVLVTGGAGTIGAAVVRRLLRDPDFEVRVSDQRDAPGWMREGCEVHRGDLRVLSEARKAMTGCTHVIHLAAIVGGIANFHKLPHTLTEVNNGLYNAVFRAALDSDVERFVYVELLDGLRARGAVPDARGLHRRLPRAAVGLRVLQAHGRGLLPRRPRRARPAVHDLPPVQRLRAGRDARGRAGHRPRRPGPDPQVAGAHAAAADLRLGRADAHAHARHRHRRRHRDRDGATRPGSTRTSTSPPTAS